MPLLCDGRRHGRTAYTMEHICRHSFLAGARAFRYRHVVDAWSSASCHERPGRLGHCASASAAEAAMATPAHANTTDVTKSRRAHASTARSCRHAGHFGAWPTAVYSRRYCGWRRINAFTPNIRRTHQRNRGRGRRRHCLLALPLSPRESYYYRTFSPFIFFAAIKYSPSRHRPRRHASLA